MSDVAPPSPDPTADGAADPSDSADDETYGEFSVDGEDQLQPEDSLVDRGVDDVLDEGYSPDERPHGVDRFGTTVEEQREGESLDQRLAQEQPEPDPYVQATVEAEDVGGEVGDEVGDDRSGRRVAAAPGSDQHEQDVLATDVGIDGAAAGAEEAAVHVIDEES